jgi:hypothetical protein
VTFIEGCDYLDVSKRANIALPPCPNGGITPEKVLEGLCDVLWYCFQYMIDDYISYRRYLGEQNTHRH